MYKITVNVAEAERDRYDEDKKSDNRPWLCGGVNKSLPKESTPVHAVFTVGQIETLIDQFSLVNGAQCHACPGHTKQYTQPCSQHRSGLMERSNSTTGDCL